MDLRGGDVEAAVGAESEAVGPCQLRILRDDPGLPPGNDRLDGVLLQGRDVDPAIGTELQAIRSLSRNRRRCRSIMAKASGGDGLTVLINIEPLAK